MCSVCAVSSAQGCAARVSKLSPASMKKPLYRSSGQRLFCVVEGCRPRLFEASRTRPARPRPLQQERGCSVTCRRPAPQLRGGAQINAGPAWKRQKPAPPFFPGVDHPAFRFLLASQRYRSSARSSITRLQSWINQRCTLHLNSGLAVDVRNPPELVSDHTIKQRDSTRCALNGPI